MKPRVIDLRSKSVAQARKIMKRLWRFRNKNGIDREIKYLLPARGATRSKRTAGWEAITTRCPYCQSPLVDTEAGIMCTSENLRDIARNIETLKRRFGDKVELFLPNRESRFYDYYLHEGRDMRCDYVQGNEERRFRVNNRILMPGVDRKKMIGGKKK